MKRIETIENKIKESIKFCLSYGFYLESCELIYIDHCCPLGAVFVQEKIKTVQSIIPSENNYTNYSYLEGAKILGLIWCETKSFIYGYDNSYSLFREFQYKYYELGTKIHKEFPPKSKL